MLRLLFHPLLWLASLPLAVLGYAAARLRRRPKIVEIVLEGDHGLRPTRSSPFARRRPPISRRALAVGLRRAGDDPVVTTLWVRIGRLTGGFAQVHALRELLAGAKARGKRVVASLDHPDLRALWLASVADEITLSPHALVDARGLALELSFFGAGLERAGVGLEVIAAGAYKSAMEPFTREAPSPESAEALEGLLESLYGSVVKDLATRSGRPPEEVRAALESGPHLAAEAQARGLVDVLLDEEAVPEHLDCHRKGKAVRIRVERYPGPSRPWPRWRLRRARLALVEVHGTIVDGRTEDEPLAPGANATAVCAALERARENKRIKGVLLHVDSRGGSATASERMWRAVRKLAAQKPVVACMGDYAASGGYYVASGARAIFAAPGTLTGSIGVISAKPVLAGLFAKLGISQARFERGPNSTMYSLSRGFTPEQRVVMERMIRHFYDLFLRRVSEGRARTPESLEPVAQGRVWTGQQALAHGLVDHLGDEQAALDWLAGEAGTDPHGPLVVLEPRTPLLRRWVGRLPMGDAGLPELREALAIARLTGEGSTLLAWSPWRIAE